jgi:hypothetical protein
MNYECHITIAIPEDQQNHWMIEALKIRIESVKWSFSCIEGDPQLGERTHCYATNYYQDQDTAIEMTKAVASVLAGKGMNVVRTKVGHIVFDTRSEL